MKEISIIIATFNAEQYIGRCLDSIVSQKNDNVELIIIDGQSKDNTVNIIKTFNNSVDIIVSEPDLGIYDAWNKGIKLASGKWIQFIGADDVLVSGAVDSFHNIINANNDRNDVDLISARCKYVKENGDFLRYYGETYTWGKFKRYMCIAHGASLHNKNLFNEVGTYNINFKICSDYELLLRKKSSLQVLYIDTVILQMQTGGMSFSLNAIKETFKIRNYHQTVPLLYNIFIFIKGILVFLIRKFQWRHVY